MLVRAIKRGFFGGIYRKPSDKPKDYFNCPSDSFSSKWMEEVKEGIKPLKKVEYSPLEAPSLVQTGKARKSAKAKKTTLKLKNEK